jgi:hypothetical protein
MTSNRKKAEAGARAWSRVFDIEANNLKNMLIDSINMNATSRKKKKASGSRRRLVMTDFAAGVRA